MEQVRTTGRLAVVNGLRGLAIIGVLFQHLTSAWLRRSLIATSQMLATQMLATQMLATQMLATQMLATLNTRSTSGSVTAARAAADRRGESVTSQR